MHQEGGMDAITVRKLPKEVARAVREKARQERLSLNKAVMKLLEEATGTAVDDRPAEYHDLDACFGTWTRKEARAFDEVLRQQRQVDAEAWK
jgi:hypothetical protein